MDKAAHHHVAASAPETGAEEAGIHLAPLRSRFAGDPEMTDLLAMFAREMPVRVQSFEACWNSRDLNRLMRLAHQLKGAGSGYGFPELSTAAGQFEATLRAILDEGENPASPRLRKEYAALLTVCRSVRGD